ncbi:hypothetical protein Scep_017431 [Stephania cephalantha]|uniref:Uncharacterized protein n=1 Tax=Stephania cephalantha TaxID=152367 RepID=A0AAP0IPG9_9MAGN
MCIPKICCEDVALAYIDGWRQMVRSLLRGRGGAQPYRVRWGYGLGRVWPWAGMALGLH